MAKAAKNNKKHKSSTQSSTDLPDMKTNAQTETTGRSMKKPLGTK